MTGRRWRGEHGVEVETTTLRGREVFRVTKDGYFVAYCATLEDVAAIVPLDTLTELPATGPAPEAGEAEED